MSELRQRLLPIAKPPLALMGALRDFSASVTERVKSLADSREVRRAAALLRIYTENLRRTIEGWSGRSQFRRFEASRSQALSSRSPKAAGRS